MPTHTPEQLAAAQQMMALMAGDRQYCLTSHNTPRDGAMLIIDPPPAKEGGPWTLVEKTIKNYYVYIWWARAKKKPPSSKVVTGHSQ